MGYYVIAVDDDPNAPGMALADKAIIRGLMNEEKLVAIARKNRLTELYTLAQRWL